MYWIRTFCDFDLAAAASLKPARARGQITARAAAAANALAIRFLRPGIEAGCRNILFDKLASVAMNSFAGLKRWGMSPIVPHARRV